LSKIWWLFVENLAQPIAVSRFFLGGVAYTTHPEQLHNLQD